MLKNLVIVISLANTVWVLPSSAQPLSRLTFDMGGGISAPLNPTGKYAGVSGNFLMGVGYNIDHKNAIVGEFLWSGLPPNTFVLQPVGAPHGQIGLYSLSANYRRSAENIKGSPFGLYLIMGGGWYYRHASVDKDYVVPPLTACQPVYGWWGYGCDGGYVYSATVASKGSSAGGLNAGTGFTIRFGDSSWKFFAESRYHYAWSDRIPTTLIPVTFGIRLN